MEIKTKIENPQNVIVEMSLKMYLGEWEKFLEQINTNYPAWKIGDNIREMILRVKKEIGENLTEEIH